MSCGVDARAVRADRDKGRLVRLRARFPDSGLIMLWFFVDYKGLELQAGVGPVLAEDADWRRQ